MSGILDFELAGNGYRAMDFTIGLAAFGTGSWEAGCSWPMVDAFAKDYLHRWPLLSEELVSVPAMMLIRELGSFVHRLGRFDQGLRARDELRERSLNVLALDRWPELHHGGFVARLLRSADL